MYLQSLHLLNFNNYADQKAEFGPGVNCLAGPNGSGKTNLLDALYFLALTKSAFSKTDPQSMKHSEPFFSVKGTFIQDNEPLTVQCSMKAGEKKQLQLNRIPYTRFSDHIGRFPVVLVTPDDTALIREGGEERRRFFDGVLSQINHSYLENLLRYNNILQQRNSILRSYAESRRIDLTLLDTYDERISLHGDFLHNARAEFAEVFTPLFNNYYRQIAEDKETMHMVYQSQVSAMPMRELLKQARQTDLLAGRSSAGIHRDDFIFNMGSHALKKFGSQGQQKCFVLALKLAQYDAMVSAGLSRPVLLLDDVFDKLDDARIQALLSLLRSGKFGQVFITDARPERSMSLLKDDAGTRFFFVENGEITAAE